MAETSSKSNEFNAVKSPIEAKQAGRVRRRRAVATVIAMALLATLAATRPASAASSNLCQRGDFQQIYKNNFGPRDTLRDWSIYNNSPGHGGNGRRSASAVKKYQGKLVITATHQNGQTVSGGMALRKTSQKYGCYRFRVRTDHDYSNVTSGVVMTWPSSNSKKAGGENDIYETTHRYAKRKPFMTFIHRPGDHSNNAKDQHWYRHEAQADRYQIMTMLWTPNEMIIQREGLDIKGRITTTRHTVPKANIPHVAHHPTIQLDARNGNKLKAPVRLELDWFEVYDYTG